MLTRRVVTAFMAVLLSVTEVPVSDFAGPGKSSQASIALGSRARENGRPRIHCGVSGPRASVVEAVPRLEERLQVAEDHRPAAAPFVPARIREADRRRVDRCALEL